MISLVERAASAVRWFALDAEAITTADTAALTMLSQLDAKLRRRRVILAFARVKGPLSRIFERAGLVDQIGAEHFFPTVTAAVDAYRTPGSLAHSRRFLRA